MQPLAVQSEKLLDLLLDLPMELLWVTPSVSPWVLWETPWVNQLDWPMVPPWATWWVTQLVFWSG